MITINATLILTVLNFIFFVMILSAVLWKPVTRLLDVRAKKIEESLRLAKDNERRALELHMEYKRSIQESRAKAIEIIELAKINAAKESRVIIDHANDKAQSTIKFAKKEIQDEVERAKTELRKDLASMAVSLAEKVLEREITGDDHRKLIHRGFETLQV